VRGTEHEDKDKPPANPVERVDDVCRSKAPQQDNQERGAAK